MVSDFHAIPSHSLPHPEIINRSPLVFYSRLFQNSALFLAGLAVVATGFCLVAAAGAAPVAVCGLLLW